MKLKTVALFLCVSLSVFAEGPPPTPVVVTKLKSHNIVEHIHVSGRVVAKQMAGLSPKVSGHVKSILKDEGDWVKAGEVLLELDTEAIQLKIKELELDIEVKKSAVYRNQQLLKVQTQELEDLRNAASNLKGSVSNKEMRSEESKQIQLKGELHQLQIELAVMRTKLSQQKLDLSYHSLKAPFDGQILERKVAEGHWVNIGEVALRLSNPNRQEVELDIPDHLFFEIENTDSNLQAQIPGTDKSIELENMKLKREVNPRTKTFVWVGQPKDPTAIVHGMTVEADVPTSKPKQALMVNYNAILKNDAGPYVYKIVPGQAGSMVVPIPVKLGFRKGSMTTVNSPALKEGDQVVTEGGERLFPMTPVAAKEVQ